MRDVTGELAALAADLREQIPAVVDPAAPALLNELSRRFAEDAIRRITDSTGTEQLAAEDAARELVAGQIGAQEAAAQFRRSARQIWDLARELARSVDPEIYYALLERVGDLWIEYERWASAVGRAHREALREQDRFAAQQHEAAVTELLTGAGGDQVRMRRSAETLGLPKSGHFCVAVIARDAVPPPGPSDPSSDRQPLPPQDPERVLRPCGVASAWSQGTLKQTGIIDLGSGGDRFERVLAALREADLGRVGLSPVFDQLSHTPLAARLADVALASVPRTTREVNRYGEHPLDTLVASAPETARDMGRQVLGALLECPTEQQHLLFTTLDVWCEAGGNINRCAELLFCHRNTVRQRLDRVQALTGRSLSDPRGVAETFLAIRAHRLHDLARQEQS